MKQHVIRFEDKKRVASVSCDNETDKNNKVAQANKWVSGGVKRKVVVANDDRVYIKLNSAGKIVVMTAAEIAAATPKVNTSKSVLLELLDDAEVIAKIKKI